jgi:alpha,alpha-trehalose phosphorylase
VADHLIETENEYNARTLVEPDIAKNVFRVQAKAGVPIRITKLVSYHTSRGRAGARARRPLPPHARSRRGRGRRASVRAAAHLAGWLLGPLRRLHHRARRPAAGHPLVLVPSSRRRRPAPTARACRAKGVTGSGYSGHYFWDTEIYVLPFLAYTTPLWARNAIRMRYLMLPAARRRAHQLNEHGVLFPWRTINGEEASAYLRRRNSAVPHQRRRQLRAGEVHPATGDIEFLHREGVDIAVETARLWATLGFWRTSDSDGEESFHIHGVTGPDEYTTVVNDNLFTNVMARFNLRFAARTVREMAEDDPEAYRLMVDRLHLDPSEPRRGIRARGDAHPVQPRPSASIRRMRCSSSARSGISSTRRPTSGPLLLHFHPLVIYRYQVLKQADVVLALFLQGNHFSDEDKLADFEYYDPLTTGRLDAVGRRAGRSSRPRSATRTSRWSTSGSRSSSTSATCTTTPPTACTSHRRAGCGRRWCAASAACATTSASCPFDRASPRMAGAVVHAALARHASAVTSRRATVGRAGERRPLVFSVRGALTRSAGEEVVVPLAAGPVIAGRPSLKQFADVPREDGTLLSASVPTVTTTIPIIGSGATSSTARTRMSTASGVRRRSARVGWVVTTAL